MSRTPRRGLRRQLAGTLALALGLTLSTTAALVAAPADAGAATADPGAALEPGNPLPWRYETTLGDFRLAGAAPDFLMHSRTQWDENRGRTYSVLRASDGTLVTTFERPWTMPDDQAPRLVGHSYVEMTPVQDATGLHPGHLDIHNLDTGATTTIDLTGHSGYLHGDDQWALVVDAGPTSTQPALTFLRADGSTVAVPSLNAGSALKWVGGDSDTAYVTGNGRAFALDPRTGAATEVTAAGSPLPLWAVTTGTLVASEDTYVSGVSVKRFTTVDRSTGQVLGQADVAADSRIAEFLPYGDRVAALYLPVGGATTLPSGETIRRYELRPVDMATGALQAPVATDLVDADAMGDGRVALTIGDVPTGRLAVIADGTAPAAVADLPRIGYQSLDVGLSDGTAVTSLQSENGLWTAADDGSGQWDATYPDSTPADIQQRSFALGGDTVLTQLTPSDSPGTFRLAWPGGHRDLNSRYTPTLGRDGRYLVTFPPGTTSAEVRDARTGAVVTSWSGGRQWQLDGSTLWTGPATDGTMTGVDLSGQQPVQTATVPVTCDGKVPLLGEVRGRFALLQCTGWVLVDLWGVVPPWNVPTSRYATTLGDGFVSWVDVSSDRKVISLRVADLTPTHTSRAYGPLRGQTYKPGADFAADTAERPDLVYVDTSNRVRHVHLDWLGQPPLTRPDGTAPVVTQSPTLAPVVRSSAPVQVTPSWTYREPDVAHEPQSGLTTADVRWRPYPGSGTWTEPAEWAAQQRASVAITLNPGQGRCFESRARDAAGNTSAWSEPVCSYVDDAAPVLQHATGTKRFVPNVVAAVTYRYGAQDDYRLATYDVATRSARRGEPLGAWRTLRSGATGTTGTAVTVQAGPGSERCFRFRAHDIAGNVSAWSPPRCSVLPLDDTEMRVRGAVTRTTNDVAVVGTYTELDRRGASATLPGQSGRTVALWAVSGPYSGAVDVYAGGRHLGRVALTSSWQRRTLFVLPALHRWTGAVRVVSTTNRPARIDAIGVQR